MGVPKLKKNSGVVFITVLMIMMVMMVITISIISVNVSQVMMTEREIRRVKAEIVANGVLSRYFSDQLSGAPNMGSNFTEDTDGDGKADFSVTTVVTPNAGVPDTLDINVIY